MNLINFECNLSDLSNNNILTKQHREAAFLSMKLLHSVTDLLGAHISTNPEELVKMFQAYVAEASKE